MNTDVSTPSGFTLIMVLAQRALLDLSMTSKELADERDPSVMPCGTAAVSLCADAFRDAQTDSVPADVDAVALVSHVRNG